MEGTTTIPFSLIQKAMQGYEDLKAISYPHINEIACVEFDSQLEVITFRDKEEKYLTSISF